MAEEWASALLAVVSGVPVAIAQDADDKQLRIVLPGSAALSFVVAVMNLLIRALIGAG